MRIGLGENFPYTNFHDLNLDWILSVIREFKEEYTSIIDDINLKLNAPVIDPNGHINDVLFSNGDGTTRWDRLEIALGTEIATAVDEWLEEHPEATTTVEDNSIDVEKLTRKLRGMVTPSFSFDYTSYVRGTVYNNGFLSDKTIQSFCYDTARHKFIVGCSVNGSDEESRLIILNSDDINDIDRIVELNLGHCNDMDYEPETDTIFVATGSELIMLNAGTFSVKNRLTFDGISPWQFTIMPDGYFLSDNLESRVYNREFTNYTVYTTNPKTIVENYLDLPASRVVMQSAIFMYDMPYLIFNITQPDETNYYKTVFVSIRNGSVISLKSFYDFTEVEGAIVVNHTIYTVFGQRYVGIGKQNVDFEILPANKMTSISANSDLNNYIIPGVYIIHSHTEMETIAHIPFDAQYSGGKLIVDKTNGNYIRQTLILEVWGWGEQIYTRGYNGAFTDWYRLSMRKATTDSQGRYEIENIITVGYLTSGKKEILASLPLNEYGDIEFAGLYLKAITQSTYIIGDASARVNLDNPNSLYSYTLVNSNNGTYQISIKKKDDSAFDVTDNNTPVILNWGAYYKLI